MLCHSPLHNASKSPIVLLNENVAQLVRAMETAESVAFLRRICQPSIQGSHAQLDYSETYPNVPNYIYVWN